MMDKAILKAAVAELRKELRAHGGKSLMPEKKDPEGVEIEVDEEPDEEPAEPVKAEKHAEEAARKRR